MIDRNDNIEAVENLLAIAEAREFSEASLEGCAGIVVSKFSLQDGFSPICTPLAQASFEEARNLIPKSRMGEKIPRDNDSDSEDDFGGLRSNYHLALWSSEYLYSLFQTLNLYGSEGHKLLASQLWWNARG